MRCLRRAGRTSSCGKRGLLSGLDWFLGQLPDVLHDRVAALSQVGVTVVVAVVFFLNSVLLYRLLA